MPKQITINEDYIKRLNYYKNRVADALEKMDREEIYLSSAIMGLMGYLDSLEFLIENSQDLPEALKNQPKC